MNRLRVKTEHVRGDDGCYDLTISRQSYGIRLGDESGDYVDVTPDMWQRLVAAVEIESVPEPWERVRDALDAVFGIGRPRAYPCSEEQCRRIADALGIKPGGGVVNNRCAWGSKSTGRGVCDQPCEGRYCERHAKAAAVREAGAALRAASEAVAKARDAVVEAADLWEQGAGYRVGDLERAVHALRVAVGEEAVARARLEALR